MPGLIRTAVDLETTAAVLCTRFVSADDAPRRNGQVVLFVGTDGKQPAERTNERTNEEGGGQSTRPRLSPSIAVVELDGYFLTSTNCCCCVLCCDVRPARRPRRPA